MGAICKTCNGDMLKVDGCKPCIYICEGEQYEPVKVGDDGDFFEGDDKNVRCGDCGAKHGFYHHEGCDCERCPVCGNQLISCDCDIEVSYEKDK